MLINNIMLINDYNNINQQYHVNNIIPPVYDCQVGGWGTWSPCSATCGSGSQERRREILRAESNGGVSCPDLHQTKQCQAVFSTTILTRLSLVEKFIVLLR